MRGCQQIGGDGGSIDGGFCDDEVLPGHAATPEHQRPVGRRGGGAGGGGRSRATGHVATLAAVRPLAGATYLVRDPSRATLDAVRLGSPDADGVLRTADVVVCATSARAPLFDSTLLGAGAVVIAVGSHESDARELDAALLGRATVVVEDVATALREAGDVVLAIAEGTLTADDLVPVRDVVTGAAPVPADRPLVFKSVGMSWQDLVVAEAVVRRAVFGCP